MEDTLIETKVEFLTHVDISSDNKHLAVVDYKNDRVFVLTIASLKIEASFFRTSCNTTFKVEHTNDESFDLTLITAGRFSSIQFSPEGNWIGLATTTGRVFLWNWQTTPCADSIVELDYPPHEESGVFGLKWSPDQKFIVYFTARKHGYVFSASTRHVVAVISSNISIGSEFVFSDDGTHLLCGGFSSEISVWRTSDFTQVFTIAVDDNISSVIFLPENKIAGATTRDKMFTWNMKGELIEETPFRLLSYIHAIIHSRWGLFAAAQVEQDPSLETHLLDPIKKFTNGRKGFGFLCFSHDKSLLLTKGEKHGQIRISRTGLEVERPEST